VVFVTHEGDITNTNTAYQWLNANHSLSILETADLRWGVLPGNHDIGGLINYNTYFGYDRFSGEDWYGGHTKTSTLTAISSSQVNSMIT